jgi:calcineurin-like phosphoesterase family protein
VNTINTNQHKSNIWFTADTHFGHTNIIKYCNRPFENTEEHDRVLIENWNRVVKPRDIIYHLGDFGYGTANDLKNIAEKLCGQIHFIKGNHDKSSTLNAIGKRFATVKDVHIISPKLDDVKIKIFLSHYAHRTWSMSNHGSWHLWGHSHGNMAPHGLSFDVGVDCWDFTPISLEQVAAKMATLTLMLDYNPAD